LIAACTVAVTITGVGVVQHATSQKLEVTFAPHPAFAMAANVSVADVAERVLPGVVNISSTRVMPQQMSPFDHPLFRDFFGRGAPQERLQRGLGSGVVVSADGVVLTNNHVVDKADEIRVTTSDKREFKGKVIGTDPKSDLALIKLQGASGLRPLPMGDSDKLRLGDAVLAIGNPFGVGQTVTMGIVSAKGRADMGIADYEDFIQTDAAINPGNSGGALVSLRGELIGINTAIASRTGGYQGIGFAIPTNMARPIMDSLLKTGKVRRGWLGVVIQEVTADLARAMKLPTTKGVLISDVDPQGPGVKAGIQRGDLVVKVNDVAVDSPGKLRNVIASAGADATVKLELFRDGKKSWIAAKLAALPAHLGGFAGVAPAKRDGVTVEPLSQTNRNRYNIPDGLRQGVVVTEVLPDSVAGRAGLEAGDVILELNRVKIDTVSRFSQLFSAARGQALLLIYRRGFSHYLLIRK
jgi:serine protease Do